jgi:hypothetical protein
MAQDGESESDDDDEAEYEAGIDRLQLLSQQRQQQRYANADSPVRRQQVCKTCGQYRKGHTCPGVWVGMSDEDEPATRESKSDSDAEAESSATGVAGAGAADGGATDGGAAAAAVAASRARSDSAEGKQAASGSSGVAADTSTPAAEASSGEASAIEHEVSSTALPLVFASAEAAEQPEQLGETTLSANEAQADEVAATATAAGADAASETAVTADADAITLVGIIEPLSSVLDHLAAALLPPKARVSKRQAAAEAGEAPLVLKRMAGRGGGGQGRDKKAAAAAVVSASSAATASLAFLVHSSPLLVPATPVSIWWKLDRSWYGGMVLGVRLEVDGVEWNAPWLAAWVRGLPRWPSTEQRAKAALRAIDQQQRQQQQDAGGALGKLPWQLRLQARLQLQMQTGALKQLARGNSSGAQLALAAAAASGVGSTSVAPAGPVAPAEPVKAKRLKTTYMLGGQKVKRALSAYNYFCSDYGCVPFALPTCCVFASFSRAR